MVAIPLPLLSAPGKVPFESAGRLVNSYAEPLANGARASHVRRRAPGLTAWSTDSSESGNRGSILVGSTLYSAFEDNITRFDSTGTPTSVGTLSGDKQVYWARNLKSPTPDIMVVDPDNGASTVTSTTITSFDGSGVLPAPNSVCFLDGYFFFTTGDGRCFATGLNDTTMDADTFITCEGKPDGLLRAIAFTDLYLCGQGSIEVWHDTAEPSPAFPFSRVTVIPRGLIGRNAISGFEDGIGKGIIFVGDDKVVYALNGYSPTKISTPDVDRAITSYIDDGGDADLIEMFPYVVGGHTCIVLRSSDWCWVFDMDTLFWHERQSYLSTTWRAQHSVNAFGKWLTGDTETGKLIEITETARDEVGNALVYTVESGPVSAFPNRMAVPQVTFDIAQGVGIATGVDPTQTDPSVAIQYSDDGGTNWSTPRIKKLGAQGESRDPIKLTKCGMTKTTGRRWRLTVSDAVDVELCAGDQATEVRTA